MLKLLVKKQLTEIFKGYFYNAKKNKGRSKAAVIGWFIFFLFIMAGVLGGMFTAVSLSLCGGMVKAGAGWLYFAVMAGIAVALGAFGSVFNTYSGLYLSKDNDLLLSMPVPVRDIISSRLISVYIMGAMYSATVIIPALIVYWAVAGVKNASVIICGLLLALIISAVVLVLSCILGWVVAKISLKLKNKSFVTVLVSLIFVALYYLIYFKANDVISNMLLNAGSYSEKLKGSAYAIFLFGRIGEGDRLATAVYCAVSALLMFLTWRLLSKSFLSIATATGAVKKEVYVEKAAKRRSPFRALVYKELAKFKSSPNYMLNCGLGILVVPIAGVLLLVKGSVAVGALNEVFASVPGSTGILFTAALMVFSGMNDMAAPSVSLEGKSIWIPQSLPVEPKTVLRAKAATHLLLSGIPMLFAIACVLAVLRAPAIESLLIVLVALLATAFSAVSGMYLGTAMANVSWTNEIIPIKQSGAVLFAILLNLVMAVVFAGLYMLEAYKMGFATYLAIWAAVFAGLSLAILHWLDTKGAGRFSNL